MQNILIVDDTPFWRDVTKEALEIRGYAVTTAADGLEAINSLRIHGADLIILDVEMPQMPGLAFLNQIRKKEEWKRLPVIMLTGDMHREHVLQAKKLGAVDYLLKARFSLPELLSRVERGLGFNASTPRRAAETAQKPPANTPAPSEFPRLLDRDQSIARAEKVMSAVNLSPTVSQVISLANSPRTELSDLAALIGHDPVLAARVLQASNRAASANGRGVITTLSDAVRLVGCTCIRDIAASVGIFDAMPAPSEDGFDAIRSWQHSLAVATICGRLASPETAGAAYLVGLCHDLGGILFRTHFGTEYHKVLQAQGVSSKPLDELERLMLGVTHGELVRTILQCLELPELISNPIALFHESTTTGGGVCDRLGRILQMADFYATGTLLAASEQSMVRPLSRSECRAAVDVEDPPPPDGVELRGKIYAMTSLYARHSVKGQSNVIEPFYARQPKRLFVAREPSLSSFDPICAALESLAEVSVKERLPASAELAACKGLVVLTRSDVITGFTAREVAAAAAQNNGIVIPTLWLAGRRSISSHSTPAEILPTIWPTSLKELAEFTRRL